VKYRFIKSATILVVLMTLCVVISSCGDGDYKQMNEIQKITIIAKEENINVEITDSNDRKDLSRMFNKSPKKDSPSCPFGYVEFVVETQNETHTLYPATDGCHNFRFNKTSNYFSLNNEEWEGLIQILKKYGIERSLLESGKGI